MINFEEEFELNKNKPIHRKLKSLSMPKNKRDLL